MTDDRKRTRHTHCTQCRRAFIVPVWTRGDAHCEDCLLAEDTTPECTCLIDVDAIGWDHALACPRRRREAVTR